MKNITYIYILCLLCLISCTNDNTNSYLNQEPPGEIPKIFAPGLISTVGEYEFGITFSKAADECYFAVKLDTNWKAEIRYTKLINGEWLKPKLIGLDGKFSYNDPYLSKDEKRLYFISDRTIDGTGEPKDIDIWYLEKENEKWGEPKNKGKNINIDKNEFYISITDNNTIYFASNAHASFENEWDYDIYYSKVDDIMHKPIRLNHSINSKAFECDAFVSPDESYMIFCSTRHGGYGQGDLHISFKDDNGNWSEAKNMGSLINTDAHEFCPFVSKDGKYFFYTSNGNIYWVKASILSNFNSKKK